MGGSGNGEKSKIISILVGALWTITFAFCAWAANSIMENTNRLTRLETQYENIVSKLDEILAVIRPQYNFRRTR